MTLIAFELSMPNNNAWNGKWTGAGNLYCRVESIRSKEVVERVLADTGYYYNFGDGWGAHVAVHEVDAATARKLRKASKGFCGYDWMIEQIKQHGRILKLDEQRSAYIALKTPMSRAIISRGSDRPSADLGKVRGGEWWAGQEKDGKVFVEGPFNPHDVRLYLNGDFCGKAEELAYAKEVAVMLNAASNTAKPAPDFDHGLVRDALNVVAREIDSELEFHVIKNSPYLTKAKIHTAQALTELNRVYGGK